MYICLFIVVIMIISIVITIYSVDVYTTTLAIGERTTQHMGSPDFLLESSDLKRLQRRIDGPTLFS